MTVSPSYEGLALEYASSELRGDREVVQEAVKQSGIHVRVLLLVRPPTFQTRKQASMNCQLHGLHFT